MSATGKRGAAGFTLLETLVVLAIIGLIAGLSFPRLQAAIAAQQFRSSVAALTLALRETRAQAVRTGGRALFVLSKDGHSFAVDARPQPALPAATKIASIDRGAIAFFADGTSTGGRLVISDSVRSQMLTVYPETGLVAVQR